MQLHHNAWEIITVAAQGLRLCYLIRVQCCRLRALVSQDDREEGKLELIAWTVCVMHVHRL